MSSSDPVSSVEDEARLTRLGESTLLAASAAPKRNPLELLTIFAWLLSTDPDPMVEFMI